MIPIPFNEEFRLAVLDHFSLLDTAPEERFDRITRLATRHFDVPIAVVSLVGAKRQWFKSTTGLDAAETPREISLCGHAIINRQVLVVLDARRDPRFSKNPLVTGEPNIRFYAGAPLVSVKGFRFGTLCLIDREPRAGFSREDEATLTDLAAMVVEELYRNCAGTGGGEAWRERSQPSIRRSPHPADFLAFEQSQAHSAQTLFIASLSHELRTPLNAIMGFSDVLSHELFGPVGSERYLEYARHISDSAGHLVRFVESILDFVKAEKGEISLHEDWVDVAESVRKCRALFTEQIRKARLGLTWSSAKDLPFLRADPQLIMQMLVNLIGNGIKFTESGGTIAVAANLAPDGGLILSVADSGIGIAPGDLDTALGPFGQVDNAMTRRHGGSGLGLSLTRQFVALHGGELALESQPGIGTTVRLRFPAYRVGSAADQGFEQPGPDRDA